jgi:hypothetical protein
MSVAPPCRSLVRTRRRRAGSGQRDPLGSQLPHGNGRDRQWPSSIAQDRQREPRQLSPRE